MKLLKVLLTKVSSNRLPVRRKNFALCVHDDHVYVAGGIGVDGGYLNTVHRFAIKENRWETLAPMSKRRAAFSLLYLNGCLYSIGGNSDANNMTNTTETFDVRRQKWKKGPVLPNPRAQYGATGKLKKFFCKEKFA